MVIFHASSRFTSNWFLFIIAAVLVYRHETGMLTSLRAAITIRLFPYQASAESTTSVRGRFAVPPGRTRHAGAKALSVHTLQRTVRAPFY